MVAGAVGRLEVETQMKQARCPPAVFELFREVARPRLASVPRATIEETIQCDHKYKLTP